MLTSAYFSSSNSLFPLTLRRSTLPCRKSGFESEVETQEGC